MFGDENKIKKPISFVKPGEKWQSDAINYIEKDVNGVTRFAITRNTHNGKYLRGNMLFYSLNGVEIYTESTNVIFVDTVNNVLFIRDHERVINEITPKDPEEKQYIILYSDLGYENAREDDEFPFRWEAVTGRTMAYEHVKINAPIIDVDKSIVIVETVAVKDALSVREFMNYIKNSDIVKDESFDINDFSGSEYI